MYWFKKNISVAAMLCLTSGLFSCNPDVKVDNDKYFDIKGYFTAEASRLSKSHPFVNKTVGHNKGAEQKKIHINNWQDELGLFRLSDINKPAWKTSYKATTHGDTVTYTARQPDLKTRIIRVINTNGQVKSIYIQNKLSNLLYNSTEELTYLPDSVYTIHKTQNVRLLGVNNYDIQGKFSN